MSGLNLSRGMKIEWNSFEFLIEERLSNGQLRLLNKHNDERRLVEEISLVEASFEGNLKIIGFGNENINLEKRIEKTRVFDFTALDESDPRKADAQRKFQYVKELLAKKKAGFCDKEIAEIIVKVSEKIKDANPPSVRTVWRWRSSYIESGEDIRALISADKSKGNRESKLLPNRMTVN